MSLLPSYLSEDKGYEDRTIFKSKAKRGQKGGENEFKNEVKSRFFGLPDLHNVFLDRFLKSHFFLLQNHVFRSMATQADSWKGPSDL